MKQVRERFDPVASRPKLINREESVPAASWLLIR